MDNAEAALPDAGIQYTVGLYPRPITLNNCSEILIRITLWPEPLLTSP